MKKKILTISILTLLLTSCGDKYEHNVEPTGGAILLYVFLLCFIIPFFALSISFLIRGIRRLRKKPPIASGKKFTITGGIFGGVGLTLLIVLNILYFPNPISVPDANKYNNPAKAMEAAVDEDKCEFSVAQEYSPYYYKDKDFLLRDAIKGIKDYKGTSNFRKVKQDCDSFHYYVSLNKTNQYDVFPFVQISIFANGNFFVDYVRSKNNGTVSYYYKMNQVDAENLVAYAYQVRSKYRKDNSREEDEYNAEVYEEGRIEKFFNAVSERQEAKAAIPTDTGVLKQFSFTKEGFDVIGDFRYVETDRPSYNSSKTLLYIYANQWTFALCKTNDSNYFVKLNYKHRSQDNPNNVETLSYYYSVRESDGETIVDIAIKEYKEQHPEEFDLAGKKEEAKIENFFERPEIIANFSSVFYKGHTFKNITISGNAFSSIKGLTYVEVEQSSISEQTELLDIVVVPDIWTLTLFGDQANSKNYYLRLVYTFEDIFGVAQQITIYYQVSNTDGEVIYNTALNELELVRPEVFYSEYEEGKIENFFTNVATQDNDRCSFYYNGQYHMLTIKKEDLVTVSNLTYTLDVNQSASNAGRTMLRIYNFSPFWEFLMIKNNGQYHVRLKYTYHDSENALKDIYYTYLISSEDSTILYNLFLTKCVEQHPEVFSQA